MLYTDLFKANTNLERNRYLSSIFKNVWQVVINQNLEQMLRATFSTLELWI